jgi:hypothetical protein
MNTSKIDFSNPRHLLAGLGLGLALIIFARQSQAPADIGSGHARQLHSSPRRRNRSGASRRLCRQRAVCRRPTASIIHSPLTVIRKSR